MFEHIRKLISNGAFAEAFDEARSQVEVRPANIECRFLAVLALARTGHMEHAIELYENYGLRNAALEDPNLAAEVAGLWGRLNKDRGLTMQADSEARQEYFQEAFDTYQAEFERRQTPHSGINCAALSVWLGRDDSTLFAQQVLTLKPKSYFDCASNMEAHLILGRGTEALQAARQALTFHPGASDRATTIAQLKVHQSYGLSAQELINSLKPGPVIRVLGNMPGGSLNDNEMAVACEQAEDNITALNPSHIFCSLAAGADLTIAHQLLEKQFGVNVLLPCMPEQFIAYSIAPYGEEWGAKFREVLAGANDVQFVFKTSQNPDRSMLRATSRLTMGKTLLAAQAIDVQALQVAAIGKGKNSQGPGSTMEDLAVWQRAGQTNVIFGGGQTDEEFQPKPMDEFALVFADLKGYSSLTPTQLGIVHHDLFPSIASLLSDFENVRFSNTWGDGIFLALGNAHAAARIAYQMTELVDRFDKDHRTGTLRIGLHYGAATPYHDPIADRLSLYGPNVNHAARIEPVSMPGLAHASEHFSAALALEMEELGKRDFKMEYAGKIDLAKDAGASQLFRLEKL